MNTGNHIEGNTYTRAFLLNLVAAREVGRSWVYIASYLNQQGKYPVLSARWTDANVGQVVTRFIDKEAAKIVATDEEVSLRMIAGEVKIEKEIHFPDGTIAFRIIKL